ncbi:MAG TPA: zinc-dependent metalloprotease [Acidimicrobiia bacterium]|nr:zinc-dependent metalloprotease [Acidimicrobiia bacterium]
MSAVHWPLATAVAARLAGRYPLEGTYHFALLNRQAPELVRRAAELVSAETRLSWAGEPQVGVVTRAEWCRANVAAFGRLLAPAEAKLASRAGLGRHLAGRLLGAEVGAMVGVLARRVLGQYELVVPTGDGSGDTVMLVGGNLLAMERQHEFRPAEFRLWVALHECTHRLQFTAVPWVGSHFLGLVSRLVESSAAESSRMSRLAGEMRAAAREGRPMVDETGLMGLLATPEQRRLIDEAQALMSVLEGHGHVVMDRIGARVLVGQDRMSRVLKARRRDRRYSAFLRLTGLEMKMKQYELGERFMQAVERQGGFGAIDRVWEGPQNLPTLDEIRNPSRWLERVA